MCHVKFHDSTEGDTFAADWPTALESAIDGMEVDHPTVYSMSFGSMLILTSDKDEKVSIREKEVVGQWP